MQVTCDNCRQIEKVRREFNCNQCGAYVVSRYCNFLIYFVFNLQICDMCYDDYLEKNENQQKHKNLQDTSSSENEDTEEDKEQE